MRNRLIYIFCIIIFLTSFVYIDDGTGIGRRIQLILILFLAFYILPHYGYISKIKIFSKINRYVFIYASCLVISSFVNRDLDIISISRIYGSTEIADEFLASSWFLGAYYAVSIVCSVLFIEYVVIKKKTLSFCEIFQKILLAFLFVNDLLALLNVHLFSQESYLLGNKFTVSYLHFYAFSLFFFIKRMRNETVKTSLYLYASIVLMLIFLSVSCITAFVGSVLFVSFYNNEKVLRDRLLSGRFIVNTIVISSSLFLFFSWILNLEPIVALLNMLGRDPTLTSRVILYKVLLPLLIIHPFWGFGSGNTHAVLNYLYGFPNAQNAVVEVVLSNGVVTLFFLILFLLSVLKICKKYSNASVVFPISNLIFIFIILGCVETTFNERFVSTIAFLLLCIKAKVNG